LPGEPPFVACHEPVSHHNCGTQIRKECAVGALNSFFDCTDCGNGSEADIDCRMAARRVERKRHQPIVALPPPPDPPFDLEKRRGIGGVLDGGEAGARRGVRRAGRANQTMEPIEAPPHAIWRDDFEDNVEAWRPDPGSAGPEAG
jgi:hypothetical protein